MMMIRLLLVPAAVVFLLTQSCSVAQYIPEDRYLLETGKLSVKSPDSINTDRLESAAESVVDLQTTPKWRVWWYHQRGFLMGWLGKRFGREPILYEEGQERAIARNLEAVAVNHGFFWNETEHQIQADTSSRTLSVDYRLQVAEPYTIDSLVYAIDDSLAALEIASIRSESLIEIGAPYDLGRLRAERTRIETHMREQGYYYFVAQDLEYIADTVANRQGVILLLKLADKLPANHLLPQRIGQIRVFSDFSQAKRDFSGSDTINYKDLEIVCQTCPLRSDILDDAVAYEHNVLYTPGRHERTVKRLVDLNMFRYVSLNYNLRPGSDTILDLDIYLTPHLRRHISGEAGAAFIGGGYFGPELGITYRNRNLLGGAELLSIKSDFVYNWYLGDDEFTRIPRSGVIGLVTELTIPRLWVPWSKRVDGGLRSRFTIVGLGFEVSTLSLNLASFEEEINSGELQDLQDILIADSSATEGVSIWRAGLSMSYKWSKRATINHQLFPLSVNYQYPKVSNEDLLTLSRSLGVDQGGQGAGRLDRILSLGPSYQWKLDTRQGKARRHHLFASLNTKLRFNRAFPIGENVRNLDAESSQYIQPEMDVRYYWQVNSQIQLATRLHSGVALPFSKRAIVPYFDLFTIGGPNSLRGFLPRGLGPGITVPLENSLLGLNGLGNLLFETQVELRYRFIPSFEVAAFADLGNVWLYRTEAEPTVGDFDFSRFNKELASDAGIGARIDLGFLLLRLDVAKPLRIPSAGQTAVEPNRDWRFVLAFGQAF